ncbi:ribose-phosphate pyrophosphokinase, partial [Bifidobacteriaceae bacterium WP021]
NWIMEQLLMVDSLRRASARSINVVAPFFGYSRQDKKHQGREPITARLMFDLFRAAGATRILTVDMHATQEQGFFDGPVDHLTAMPVLIDYVRNSMKLDNATIVS